MSVFADDLIDLACQWPRRPGRPGPGLGRRRRPRPPCPRRCQAVSGSLRFVQVEPEPCLSVNLLEIVAAWRVRLAVTRDSVRISSHGHGGRYGRPGAAGNLFSAAVDSDSPNRRCRLRPGRRRGRDSMIDSAIIIRVSAAPQSRDWSDTRLVTAIGA